MLLKTDSQIATSFSLGQNINSTADATREPDRKPRANTVVSVAASEFWAGRINRELAGLAPKFALLRSLTPPND